MKLVYRHAPAFSLLSIFFWDKLSEKDGEDDVSFDSNWLNRNIGKDRKKR